MKLTSPELTAENATHNHHSEKVIPETSDEIAQDELDQLKSQLEAVLQINIPESGLPIEMQPSLDKGIITKKPSLEHTGKWTLAYRDPLTRDWIEAQVD